MKSLQIHLSAFALACLTLGSPALAQNTQKAPPDADTAFLTGLRKVGVMAGQVVACTEGAAQKDKIAQAMDLADEIALHYGLRASFNFVGAVGYGSGHAFDKAGCAQALKGWEDINQKYLSK